MKIFLASVSLYALALVPFAQATVSPIQDICKLRNQIHLGDVTINATSNNHLANEHFILGVTFLHAFMYELATKQFQHAQQLDPGFAMSYWGEAMAYKQAIWNHEDLNKAQAVLKRYEKNRDRRSLDEKEARYLESVRLLFGNQSLLERDKAYMFYMKKLHKDFPNDPNVGAFFALSQLGLASDFPNDLGCKEHLKAGKQTIQQLLKNFPDHPGLVHYYIHFHDVSEKNGARAALIQANKVLSMMRSSSHITHMSAHIYRRLGRWDDFILANDLSVKASDDLCSLMGYSPSYACDAENKYHSLEWLHYGYLIKNQFDKAQELVDQMAAIVKKDQGIQYLQWFYRMWARQILSSEKWAVKTINVKPIAKQDDQLYWSAYSECGALLAQGFLNSSQNKSVFHTVQRLDEIIKLTQILPDPYVNQTCQISKFLVQAKKARDVGELQKAREYKKRALDAENSQLNTELTPSLSFISVKDFDLE